jgi:hypothetical protein
LGSASTLRDWLELQRTKLIGDGVDVPWPQPGDGAPNDKGTDWLIKTKPRRSLPLLVFAGLAWITAFSLFAVEYGPILFTSQTGLRIGRLGEGAGAARAGKREQGP